MVSLAGGEATRPERTRRAFRVRTRRPSPATMRKVLSASVIESKEASASIQNVDLLDLWHQRHHTAENEGFATPFLCTLCTRRSPVVSNSCAQSPAELRFSGLVINYWVTRKLSMTGEAAA